MAPAASRSVWVGARRCGEPARLPIVSRPRRGASHVRLLDDQHRDHEQRGADHRHVERAADPLLSPQPRSTANSHGFRIEDRVENRLYARVCSGRMTFRAAQRAMRTNWVRAFERFARRWAAVSRGREVCAARSVNAG
jgi:hypothetical protein